jgi:hypothetical protein
MITLELANNIYNALDGLTEPGGINDLWDEVCDFVDDRAEVPFTWVGMSTSTPPTPDPTVEFTASIDTTLGGSLILPPTLKEAQTASEAMSILSLAMIASMTRWVVKFPEGFTMIPPIVPLLPPPLTLTPSGLTDRMGAITLLSSQIVAAIKLTLLPSVMFPGNHNGMYTGTATFIPGTIF